MHSSSDRNSIRSLNSALSNIINYPRTSINLLWSFITRLYIIWTLFVPSIASHERILLLMSNYSFCFTLLVQCCSLLAFDLHLSFRLSYVCDLCLLVMILLSSIFIFRCLTVDLIAMFPSTDLLFLSFFSPQCLCKYSSVSLIWRAPDFSQSSVMPDYYCHVFPPNDISLGVLLILLFIGHRHSFLPTVVLFLTDTPLILCHLALVFLIHRACIATLFVLLSVSCF